jgi:hypothetical protein
MIKVDVRLRRIIWLVIILLVMCGVVLEVLKE